MKKCYSAVNVKTHCQSSPHLVGLHTQLHSGVGWKRNVAERGLPGEPSSVTAVVQGIILQLPIFGHTEKGGKSFSPKTSYNLLLETPETKNQNTQKYYHS